VKHPRVVAIGFGGVVVVLLASPWIGRLRGRPDVPTLIVSTAPFERRVAAEGNLEAAEATPVTAPIDAQGQLKVAWLIPDGTPVKKGDVVVKFDPSEMERSLRDGQSDRTATDSRITGMRADTGGAIRNLERDGALAREELKGADRYKTDDPDVFSRQEIIRSEIDRNLATKRIDTSDAVRSIRQDVAKVDLDLLDIERRKAGIAIERASKGLDALEIRAPNDGILVYKRDWRGDITRVGDTVWPGEPVAEVPDLKKMEARVYVLEADAGGLAKGLSATVTVEAHPSIAYKGKIKKVDTLAKRRTGWIPVQYFGATLELDATDTAVMKPGQRVRAVLALDARPDAFSLPRNAIFEKNGKKVVYKLTGGEFAPVEVTLGPAAVGRVVVEKGVAAGDEIALRDPTAAAGDDDVQAAGAASPTALPGAR
jgi:RND family efflux transporter MFP subunit